VLKYNAMLYNRFLVEPGPAGAPPRCEADSRHRILIVDDDRCTRQINTIVLTQAGYQVDAANDGAAGWEAIQSKPYDLVITDNHMPNLTGIGMLKKLRAAQLALPVIMATGEPPTEEFARDPSLQPEATLLRPYAVEKLLNTIEVVLRVADDARNSGKR